VRPASSEWVSLSTTARSVAGVVVLFGTLTMLPSKLYAQHGRSQVGEGNKLYAEGHFDEAYEKYLEALRANPGSPIIRFNEGNALYQTQEFQRALDAYRAAIASGDPDLASSAWYNLGNALYRQQQLEQALEAYKQALRLDPTDEDTKHNLELVLDQMQQQERQQQRPQRQEYRGQEKGQQQDSGSQQEHQRDEQPSERQQQQQPGEQQPGQQQQEQQEPEPEPGAMTREEAERLLQALHEDPDQIARRRAARTVRQKPKKEW
jgi:Ca-activated chloride channel family protein